MNMQNIPQPPPMAQNNPEGHFYWYISQGFPYQMAYDLTAQKFGAPKSKEEQAREAAAAKEKAAWAGQAGQLAGGIVGIEAFRGFPNVKEWLGYKPAGEVAAPNVLGAQRVGTPGAQVPATPKVLEVKGSVSTVQTPTGVQDVPTEALNDPGFWGAVDWGQVAQGGLALVQLYGAYKAFKSGDKAGAGISGAAALGNLAATGALGAGAAGAASSAAGGYLIPGLNLAAGLYSGYQTAEALSDMAAGKQRYRTGAMGGAGAGAATGAAIGSVVPGPGTAIGAAIGAAVGGIAGALGAKFGSSKGKGQMQRDAVRDVLQQGGILDDNWQGTLADGSVTDFGKDGSILNTKAMQKLAEQNPGAYESTVQLSDALVSAYGFLGDKNRSLGRMFVRGALSNAGDDPTIAMNNMRHFAAEQGITFDLMKTKLDEGLSEGRIEQPEYNRLLTAATQLVPSEGAEPVQVREVRPEAGKVNRLSEGLYRDASGNLVKADSMRAALEKAYKSKKSNKKSEEL